MIAEVIRAHQAGGKKAGKAKAGKKSKKGRQKSLCTEQTSSILKELKNALRPVMAERRGEEGSRPSTPMRSAHDQLMESIRGSSIGNLRRVSGGAKKKASHRFVSSGGNVTHAQFYGVALKRRGLFHSLAKKTIDN